MKFESAIRIIMKHCIIDNNEVCFSSFSGLYNDNPLYISEALHRLKPNCKIVWLIDERCKEIKRIPSYVTVIKADTFKAMYHTCRAKVFVENFAGLHFGFCEKSKYALYSMLKSKRQFNISTWHGTPLKKIGLDAISNASQLTFFTTSDLLISGNEYEASAFKRVFMNKIPILKVGSPRNDLLYDSYDNTNVKRELGLDQDYKYLIFAPTFRDSEKNQKGINILSDLNVEKLINSFELRFGGKWKMIVRSHQMIQQQATSQRSIFIIDGNLHDDMAKYLLACDALITDYSSSFYDFMITDKPCFLYVPDLDFYTNKDRGLYAGIDSLPFDICKTNDELNNAVMNYNESLMLEKRYKYKERLHFYGNGRSSEIVAALIVDITKHSDKNFSHVIKKYLRRYNH